MAAFSPQDLMSPMKKMEASLEEIKKSNSSIVEVMVGTIQPNVSLLSIIQLDISTIKDTLTSISKKLNTQNVKDKIQSSGSNAKSISKNETEMLIGLGEGVKSLALGLILFKVVPTKTSENVAISINNIVGSLENINKDTVQSATLLGYVGKAIFDFTKYILITAPLAPTVALIMPIIAWEIKKFGELLGSKEIQDSVKTAIDTTYSLGEVGESVLIFEGCMVLAGLLVIPATIAMTAFAAQVWLFSVLLGNDKMQKKLEETLKNTIKLGQVGASILAFEGTMVLAGLLAIPAVILMPAIVITVGLVTLISKAIGKNATDVVKGALALLIISGAFIVFSAGLIVFANAVHQLDWMGILVGSAVLLIFGGAVIGLGAASQFSILGSIALILIGAGLLAFSLGIAAYGKEIRQWSWKDVGMAAGILAAITAPIIGLGVPVVAGFAMLGAVTLMLIGVSLIVLSKGLKAIQSVGWKKEDSTNLYNIITGVSSAMLGIDVEQDKGLFKKIGKAVGTTAKFAMIGVASAGIAAAGGALVSLAIGLKVIKSVEWTEEDTKGLTVLIAGVSSAFASMSTGAENVKVEDSLKKVIASFSVNPKDVEKGIRAVQGSAKALKQVSKGITEFTAWFNANKDIIDLENTDSEFYIALDSVLRGIGNAFADIGDNGFGKNKNATRKGIKAVKGVEEALTGISKGIVDFTSWYKENEAMFKESKDSSGNIIPAQSGTFFVALNTTINSVAEAFAKIAKGDGTWDEDDVKDGIKSVKDIQSALTNISEGLKVYVDNAPEATKSTEAIDTIFKLGEAMGKFSDVNGKKAGTSFETFSKKFVSGLNTMYKQKETTTRMKSAGTLLLIMERQVKLKVYDKTADGIKKIADAVNTIDVDKGKAFSNLFVAASKLKDNTKFYQDLKKAVEDIRKILEEQGVSSLKNTTNTASSASSIPQQQVSVQPTPANTPAQPKQSQSKPNVNLSGATLKVDRLTINAETVEVN